MAARDSGSKDKAVDEIQKPTSESKNDDSKQDESKQDESKKDETNLDDKAAKADTTDHCALFDYLVSAFNW